MREKQEKGDKTAGGKYQGKEIVPLSNRENIVFELEELERRLEMQSLPVDIACGVQAPGCYTDGCEGEYYCYDYCGENNCDIKCYCEGGWCTLECTPQCGLFCHENCLGDICAAQVY